jgi:hypothetical protein
MDGQLRRIRFSFGLVALMFISIWRLSGSLQPNVMEKRSLLKSKAFWVHLQSLNFTRHWGNS